MMKKQKQTIKITEEEYNHLTDVFTERVKNIIYMNAKQRIQEQLPKSRLQNIINDESETPIFFTWELKLLVNDFREALGGYRRKQH